MSRAAILLGDYYERQRKRELVRVQIIEDAKDLSKTVCVTLLAAGYSVVMKPIHEFDFANPYDSIEVIKK